MVEGKIIKFRDDGEIQGILDEYRLKLGLSDDSKALRALVKQGTKIVDELFQQLDFVTQDYTPAQIDDFLTTIGIMLKNRENYIPTKKVEIPENLGTQKNFETPKN